MIHFIMKLYSKLKWTRGILKLVAFNFNELFIDCIMEVKETSLFQESLYEDMLKDIFNCNFRKILKFFSSYECLIVSIVQSLYLEISIQNILPCVWREIRSLQLLQPFILS